MRWPKILTVLFLCVVGFKLVWALAYPTSHHRFRLTVNVETPTGLRSGSSVMETVVERQPGWFGLHSGGHLTIPSLVGEAVFVDLGSTPDGKGPTQERSRGERHPLPPPAPAAAIDLGLRS
jgi:hypothetical protein